MEPLQYIGENKIVQQIASNMRVEKDYFDDLCQEVYYILLTGYTADKLQEAIDKKQINFIVTCILKNQWFSGSSPFYKKYKRYKIKSSPIEDYKEEGIDEEQGRILPGRAPKTPPGLRR